MKASPNIRKLCGTSDNGADDLLYIKVYKEVIENLPTVILDINNKYHLQDKFTNEQIIALWSYNNIRDKINDIMDNYTNISSAKHYLKTVLVNFVTDYF